MKKHAGLLVFVLLSFTAIAQPDSHDVTLGFGCGFAGTPTAPVTAMANLVRSNDIPAIVAKLQSPVAADQFLAVVVLEYLQQKGRITVTPQQRHQIEKVKKSGKAVPLCRGCTFGDEMTLKKLLRDTDTIGTTHWLEGLPV